MGIRSPDESKSRKRVMPEAAPTRAELQRQIFELRARLDEIEPIVSAIHRGEVDALVIDDSRAEVVAFIERGASPYRLLMEESEQGAFLLDRAGCLTYCNRRLADLLQATPEAALQAPLQSFIHEADLPRFQAWLASASPSLARSDFNLRTTDGGLVPVRLACLQLAAEPEPAIAGLVTDLSEQKRLAAQLASTAAELRRLAAHIEVAREEERTRIARELHDELGGALTSLKLEMRKLQDQATVPAVRDGLGQLGVYVSDTINRVRRIATDLRPSVLDDLGLVSALEWQVAELARRTGLSCAFQASADDLDLPADMATALFRLVQEALTNVVRHAQASSVQVELRHGDGLLELAVTDDGRGITPGDLSKSSSLGLLGMRERVYLLSGEMDIQGTPGQGTSVRIRVPLASGG
jgi:PAS domain S-box-containing protein